MRADHSNGIPGLATDVRYQYAGRMLSDTMRTTNLPFLANRKCYDGRSIAGEEVLSARLAY